MEFKDYYEIMEVARDATQDEIKRSYRKLARKYHPDVSKEADAEARFKELGEAYEVLKDAEKARLMINLVPAIKAGRNFVRRRTGTRVSNSAAGGPLGVMRRATAIFSHPCLARTFKAAERDALLRMPKARIITPGCSSTWKILFRVQPGLSRCGFPWWMRKAMLPSKIAFST